MKQQTKVRFWAGLRTIGGTIVSIEHGEDRILFDFGTTYQPVDDIVKKRPQSDGISLAVDYLKLGLLPPIDGLYAQAILPAWSRLVPAEQSKLRTAVFISHLHLDHMSIMGMIAPSVAVCMTPESHALYETLRSVGEAVPGARSYQSIEWNRPLHIGSIQVTALQVDHDVPGACAYLVETPSLKLLYTGDIRLHGSHPERTLQMADHARGRGVHALIIEGTSIGLESPKETWDASTDIPEGMVTESNIGARLQAAMERAQGLVLCNIYHRNVERIAALYASAEAAGRKLVLEPETAYIASRLLGMKSVCVLDEEENTGGISLKDVHLLAYGQEWKPVTIAQINKEPNRYVLQNSFKRILSLLEVQASGALYLHSNGAPLGAYDPDYAALLDFLERLGIEFQYIGTGGHALPEHLKYIAERIAPTVYIPLHSKQPERIILDTGTRLLPEYDKTYIFNNGILVDEVRHY